MKKSVRGIETAYDDNGDGPAVVLLHGFPFDRSLWRGQVETLSGAFRVVTPDLRGHGETEAVGDVATMEEMADDVAALLDELGIERAIVGGLSMGGYVAFAFYKKYAPRVRALVLADTRPQGDAEDAKRTREDTARRALDEGMKPVADAMLPKLLAPATSETRADIVERVLAMMLGTDPRGAAAALRGMAVRSDQTDLLAEIDVPTLVLVGSEDAITPPSDAEAMRSKIKGARLARIEGAGHVSNVERPEEFDAALLEFLRGLPSS